MQPAGQGPVLPFPKSSRLLKRADFRRVYDTGFRYSGKLLSAFLLNNQDPARPPHARVGFTLPRKIGKAVFRNRMRRRAREAIRLDYALIGSTWDVVIHPRRNLLEAPFDEVRREVRKLIERCKTS